MLKSFLNSSRNKGKGKGYLEPLAMPDNVQVSQDLLPSPKT